MSDNKNASETQQMSGDYISDSDFSNTKLHDSQPNTQPKKNVAGEDLDPSEGDLEVTEIK